MDVTPLAGTSKEWGVLQAQEASACLASSGTKAAGAEHEAVDTSETKVFTFSTSPRTERLLDLEVRMLHFELYPNGEKGNRKDRRGT